MAVEDGKILSTVVALRSSIQPKLQANISLKHTCVRAHAEVCLPGSRNARGSTKTANSTGPSHAGSPQCRVRGQCTHALHTTLRLPQMLQIPWTYSPTAASNTSSLHTHTIAQSPHAHIAPGRLLESRTHNNATPPTHAGPTGMFPYSSGVWLRHGVTWSLEIGPRVSACARHPATFRHLLLSPWLYSNIYGNASSNFPGCCLGTSI